MFFYRTIEERLDEWFSPDLRKNKRHLDYSDTFIEIEETEEQGKALVRFNLRGKKSLFIKGELTNIQFMQKSSKDNKKENKPVAEFSEDFEKNKKGSRKAADGIIFVFESNSVISLHIIELKATINSNTWRKIKYQFSNALIRALAIQGILEITINNVYSAYIKDSLSTIPNSSLEINGNPSKIPKEFTEWEKASNEVALSGTNNPFKHTKIELDKNGFGEIDLTI
jgi:hypothetical protein